jgi:hypothetical protein
MRGSFYKHAKAYGLEPETPRLVPGAAGQSRVRLAWAKGRARRDGAWAKTRTNCERRRNVAQGFATGGTVLGGNEISAQPMAPRLAKRVDALQRRARHEGHCALPQRPTSSQAVSSPGRPKEFAGEPDERRDCCASAKRCQLKRTTRYRGSVTKLWKSKYSDAERNEAERTEQRGATEQLADRAHRTGRKKKGAGRVVQEETKVCLKKVANR